MEKSLIIMGSSRVDGNSHKIAEAIQQTHASDRIDLTSLTIGPFTYDHKHATDDFIPLMKKLLKYKTIILVTPVYWYSMSGLMKTFLDRITDCLQIEKGLGRQLRGKQMICVSCGSDSEEVEGFFIPFEKSADYLGMAYLGHLHAWVSSDNISESVENSIKDFLRTTFD